MSYDDGNCPECGGSDGMHYDDCIYDGTNGPGDYHYRGGSGGGSAKGIWIIYIVALIIGYAINELLGAIILIALIWWLIFCCKK